MKRISVFIGCLCAMLTSQVYADSWRINSNAAWNPDFPDINAAMADARVDKGDTLYIEQGATFSEVQTITKQVIVLGLGYDANRFDDIIIDSGAEDVKLMGLHIAGGINLREENATIERCYVGGIIRCEQDYLCDGAIVRSCYLGLGIAGDVDDYTSGWLIENNIMVGAGDFPSTLYFIDASTIRNNVCYNLIGLVGDGNTVTNNIVFWSEDGFSIEGEGNTVEGNMFSNEGSEEYPSNQYGYDKLSALFRCNGEMTADTYWFLASNSPATDYEAGPAYGESPYTTAGTFPYGLPVFQKWLSVPAEVTESSFDIALLIQCFQPKYGDYPSQITHVEYFWDRDRGHRRGTELYSGSAATFTKRVTIDVSDLEPGPHTLYLRAFAGDAYTLSVHQVEIAGPQHIIEFADANVKALCVANWDTNGDGELSEEEAAAVTDLGTVFKWNHQITSFNELSNFTGLSTIGEKVFESCSELTNVIIPSSITSIGAFAFNNCTSLTSLIIPNRVTSIGENTFYNCTSLTSLTIPNGVTSIGRFAFGACSGLTSIVVENGNPTYDSRNNCNAIIEAASGKLITGCMNTEIPDGVISIEEMAFDNCSELTSINIPSSVTMIGEYAFAFCNKLTGITLPYSVNNIGKRAFWQCKSLEFITVDAQNQTYDSRNNCNAIIETANNTLIQGCQNTTIPNTVTTIGDEAFMRCSNLTSIEIPLSVSIIGRCAFYDCIQLTSIKIPNSVQNIGDHAFYDCIKLTDVIIPNSITNIEEATFHGCRELVNVTIPNSVTCIGEYAFASCRGLADIALPNTITAINRSAFLDCEKLVNVGIPKSVKTIGASAFMRCYSLTNISIPSSVTSIEASAFQDCRKLSTISIPNSVTTIGQWAFSGCVGLTSITIPSSVTTIGQYAFQSFNGDFISEIQEPFETGKNAFNNLSSTSILYVPAGTKEQYATLADWNRFTNIVETGVVEPNTWTIGSTGDFANLNAAMSDDRVKDGDVLKILPNSNIPNSTITKAVTIEGNGYSSRADGYCGTMYVNCDGVTVRNLYSYGVVLQAKNLTVERCRMSTVSCSESETNDNVTIRGCLIAGNVSGYYKNPAKGWKIYNNIIAVSNYWGNAVAYLSDAVIDHNIIINRYSDNVYGLYAISKVTESSITNNIILRYRFNQAVESNVLNTATKFEYNIYSNMTNSYGWDNNLPNYVAESDIFACTGSNIQDSYFLLSANSPAIGYSNDGGDCGPWTGRFPYLIDGVEHYTLDATVAENTEQKVFNSLESMLKYIAANEDLTQDINVNVADGYYELNVPNRGYKNARSVEDLRAMLDELQNYLSVEESAYSRLIESNCRIRLKATTRAAVNLRSLTSDAHNVLSEQIGKLQTESESRTALETQLHETIMGYASHFDRVQSLFDRTNVEVFTNMCPSIEDAPSSLSISVPEGEYVSIAFNMSLSVSVPYGDVDYFEFSLDGGRYMWTIKTPALDETFYNLDMVLPIYGEDPAWQAGKHTLTLYAWAHGGCDHTTIDFNVIKPTVPEDEYALDPTATENAQKHIFTSLESLFNALVNYAGETEVKVTVSDATYTFTLPAFSLDGDLTKYSAMDVAEYVGTMAGVYANQLYEKLYTIANGGAINLTASSLATFLFSIQACTQGFADAFTLIQNSTDDDAAKAAAMAQLEADLNQQKARVLEVLRVFMARLKTTNISILIDGSMERNYDGFSMEPNDLLALRNIYNHLGGSSWTRNQWTFANNGHVKDDFPGVTFDGTRVVSIDLENCGLTGELVDESWNPVLSELTYLNISRNSLTGDLTPFVADMPKLKTLYAHHNRLTEISGPLPSDIASLNTRSQNRVYTGDGTGWESVRPDVAGAPLQVWLSSAQDLTLPSLFTYYAGGNDNSLVPQVFVEYTHSPGNFYGSLNRDEATGWWTFGAFNNLIYDLPQNADVWLTPETEAGLLSAYPAHLRYVPGDANFSGFTDVLDVQWTLNYILSPTNALPFNRSAANTYEDATVNVQDIVCTVNIVLENDEDGADLAGVRRRMRRQMLAEDTPAQCWFYAEDGRVKVETEVPVAALDIELEGVSTDEVSLLLNHSHYQMRGRNTARGSRYVIFSPDGSVIPADSPTALLALSRSGRPTAVQCADTDAREVASTIGLPTGVASVGVGGRSGAIYDISGRRVEQPRRGLYIQNGQKLLKK